ncbi:MAG: AraC family transcriptional regulator [Leptolyngbyaceae cyanobacterium SM2_5_2]|nr:AraC family transcriptional regulator [Leptolyngbyaceae cyanobacterium SM2_5_2]
MKTIPLVRAALLLPFTHFLDQIGAPTERLLGRNNLSAALLADPEGLIPLLPSAAFLEAATSLEGFDNLGILVGQQTQVAHLGEFGRLLHSALTPFDCLITLERTINLLNSGERVRLVWQPDGVWLQSHLFAFERDAACQARCFSLMVYLNLLQFIFGPNWQPLAIQLAVAPLPLWLTKHALQGYR